MMKLRVATALIQRSVQKLLCLKRCPHCGQENSVGLAYGSNSGQMRCAYCFRYLWDEAPLLLDEKK